MMNLCESAPVCSVERAKSKLQTSPGEASVLEDNGLLLAVDEVRISLSHSVKPDRNRAFLEKLTQVNLDLRVH